MSKFNKWLNGEENFFDVEVRVKPLKENKQSIEEIATTHVITASEKKEIVKSTIVRTNNLHNILSVLTFVIYIFILIISTTHLPKFGFTNNTWNYVSRYYIENALTDTKSVNAVTGMILDYRAFDTLGESFVLFSAVCCVFVLLQGKVKDHSTKVGYIVNKDPIVRYVSYIIIPVVFIFGVYVVLNGQLSPGGGFSGGAILGAGLILFNLAYGDEATHKFFTIKTFKTISAIALLGYAFTKCYSFLMGGMHFYDPIAEWFHSLTDGTILSGGYILILNICVGAVVACTMYGFYSLFRKGEI